MSCVIYAPWFGPLPFYANTFLEGCGKATKIQWIVHSDQKRPEIAPSNVLWIYTKHLTTLIQDAISVPVPEREWRHKLCDLKPFWHKIFVVYDAPNFDYRGWCDWDVVHDLSELEFNFDSAKFTKSGMCSPLFITKTSCALEWWPLHLKQILKTEKSCAWDELRYLAHINSEVIQVGLTPEVDLFEPAKYAVHMYRAKHYPALYQEWIKKYCSFI